MKSTLVLIAKGKPDTACAEYKAITTALLIALFSTIGIAYTIYLHGYRKIQAIVHGPPYYWDSPVDSLLIYFGLPVTIFFSFWPHAFRGKGLLPLAALVNLVGWLFAAPEAGRGGYTYLILMIIACGIAMGITVRLVWHGIIMRLIISTFITPIIGVLAVFFSVTTWADPPFEQWNTYIALSPPYLAIPSGLLLVLSIIVCARPLVESGFEWPTRLMYRIRAHGPGIPAFPARGPVIVIANHSSYLDPLFLAADIPRPLAPMMTSKFYDRPLIYPLVRFVFGVIRVPDKAVRREAPELALAVEALDRGKCLVIFPEGFLQRKPDPPLRRFGRGVWEILKARPETPVVAAWIEGNWGSYFSYFNGPPTKGKKLDFRKPIDVALSAPLTVPKEVLVDHWTARFYLMNKVGEARELLGLPRIPVMEMPSQDENFLPRDTETPRDEHEPN